jgi:hypothetical protein
MSKKNKKQYTITQAAKQLGVKRATLAARVMRGKCAAELVQAPVPYYVIADAELANQRAQYAEASNE